MSRVLVIGIDGFDREVVSNLLDEMPNLSKLMDEGQLVPYESLVPPDSPTCWASMYTGMGPAKHGVVDFKDPFQGEKAGTHLDARMDGHTFWDLAGEAGARVAVLFPHMGYPPWEVNGIMVGRTTESDLRRYELETHPPELKEKYDFSGLKPETSFPVNLSRLVGKTKRRIQREVTVAKELLDDHDWDLGFCYFSSLDNIMHIFWMYHDPSDPEYEPEGEFEDTIRSFHRHYDEQVFGRLIQSVPSDTKVIVLSDHGHGKRPTDLVNVNEWLRESGLTKADDEASSSKFLVGLKESATSLLNRSRALGWVASQFLKLFPDTMETFTEITPLSEDSLCYVTDTSGGLKAYSYGGIRLARDLPESKRPEVIEKAISVLKEIESPSGQELVNDVWLREDLYEGPHLDQIPEILFTLDTEWGIGWDTGDGLYGTSRSHRIHSGNHRRDTPFWLVLGEERPFRSDLPARPMDVCPTILDLLGLDAREEFDGASIF